MVGVHAMANYNNTIADCLARMEGFRRSDQEREQLLSDVIKEYQELFEQHHELQLEFESNRQSRMQYQRELFSSQQQLQQQAQMLDNNSFVLGLIDGDGVIFQDALLRAGANGGSEAAFKLQQAIRDHIMSIDPAAGRWSIMVQIYVSLDKLAQKLYQVGLLSSPAEFRAFAQAFNVNQPLFNIIDVGHGKERADHKIKEMLRTFSHNPTCKHIVFGGCHDAGYLLNLEEFRHNPEKASCITLLETAATYRGFAQLNGYRWTRFDDIFRSEPLPDSLPPMPIRTATERTVSPIAPPPGLAKVSSAPVASQSPRTSVASVASPSVPATPPTTTSAVTPSHTATPVNGTGLDSSGGSGQSWSTVSKTGATNGDYIIAPTKKSAKKKKKVAYYNRAGERLDERLPPRDRAAAEALEARVRKYNKNLCNHWHLNKGNCTNGKFCIFQHEPKLNPAEIVALQYKARTLPCRNRKCINIDCYLGHQCPQERDSDPPYCSFGSDCHLKASHGMDKVKYEGWEEGSDEPFYTHES